VSVNPQSPVPYPAVSQPATKGWLARNWIKLLAGVFLFFLLLGFGIFASVMAMIRSSDAATESVLRAQSNPLVVQLLGSPIKEGWLVGGSINVTTDSGKLICSPAKRQGALQGPIPLVPYNLRRRRPRVKVRRPRQASRAIPQSLPPRWQPVPLPPAHQPLDPTLSSRKTQIPREW
jgi:hypothetical protein